jgi:hypothetical protein
MKYFQHRKIETKDSHFIGMTWPFRNCDVEMHDEGFTCNCKKRLTVECYHIKSVQLGILGVNQGFHK